MQAQADDFEIGIWIDRFALTLAQEGLVIPLDELAESYVNLDKPWKSPRVLRISHGCSACSDISYR